MFSKILNLVNSNELKGKFARGGLVLTSASAFEIGAGVSTEEGVRVFSSYAHRNLFCTGMRFQANGKINARVSKAEFARRRKAYKPRPAPIRHGGLGRYAAHATSADTGAILDWPGKP